MLSAECEVRWYPEQFQEQQLAAMLDSIGQAANFLRRTVRQEVDERAPHVKEAPGKYKYLAISAKGDPPYRKSGRLQSHIGYDSKRGIGVNAGEANVWVESYGLEVSGSRPHFYPVIDKNWSTVERIMRREIPAPQYGLPGKSANRQKPIIKVQRAGGSPQRLSPGWNKGIKRPRRR